MAPPSYSREAVIIVIEEFLHKRDDRILNPYVRRMRSHSDEYVLAMMLGAGNYMSVFTEFLFFCRDRGLISREEICRYLEMYQSSGNTDEYGRRGSEHAGAS